jgi:geranylgeranyl diphosphate synthase type I
MSSRTRTSVSKSTPVPGAKAVAPNPFSALLEMLKGDVEARLLGLLDAKVDAARAHGREVLEMVLAIRSLCARGGKRVRPALAVAGFRAAQARAKIDPVIDAGVALELLHAYLLIHDDWMDGDAVRRGGPSVHVYLGRRFRSPQKGDAAGILAGDYASALATEALLRADAHPKRLLRACSAFAQMQLDAITGQQLDLMAARDTERTYILKTSSYTVSGPLRVGALLAGGSPRLLTALDRFAMPIGVAFQLRDDLLGAFGEPGQTGKPFGSDIRSGKRTLLLTYAQKSARGSDRKRLLQAVGNPSASVAELRAAVAVLETSGARAQVERRIEELSAQALAALRTANITPEGHHLLEGAALALTSRRS